MRYGTQRIHPLQPTITDEPEPLPYAISPICPVGPDCERIAARAFRPGGGPLGWPFIHDETLRIHGVEL